jgi:hypothetical protein
MQTQAASPQDARHTERSRYEKCIEASKKARWDIDADVLRGRQFDFSTSFLPDGLSKISELPFLDARDRRLMSQIQGRTYANIFGLVERFINAKMLELSSDHWFGDQKALEALVRFSEEELKHQELFRRVEEMIGRGMQSGYQLVPSANDVARVVLGKSTWAVLALTCHIELFTLVHYRESIEPGAELSPLFKDIFLHHWREESQHALLDELEWRRVDSRLDDAGRDRGVDDFIAAVGAVDGVLRAQAESDVRYFLEVATGRYDQAEIERVRSVVLRAYRWQYILSGAQNPRFLDILGGLITGAQRERILQALAPLAA